MWPFKPKQKEDPTVAVGEILVAYRQEWDMWEFAFDDTEFTSDGPTFDASVVARCPEVIGWINDNRTEIKKAVREHLKDWCDWDGEPELIAIDISELSEHCKIDASFGGDESWGDLGINVVLVDGKMADSYSGD